MLTVPKTLTSADHARRVLSAYWEWCYRQALARLSKLPDLTRTQLASSAAGFPQDAGPSAGLDRELAKGGPGPVLFLAAAADGGRDREQLLGLRWLPQGDLAADPVPQGLQQVAGSPYSPSERGWWCSTTLNPPFGRRLAHSAAESHSLTLTTLTARRLASAAAAWAVDGPKRSHAALQREAQDLTECADRHEALLPESSAPWLAAWRAQLDQQEPTPPAPRISVRSVSLR